MKKQPKVLRTIKSFEEYAYLHDQEQTEKEEYRCQCLEGSEFEEESPKSMFKRSMKELNRMVEK